MPHKFPPAERIAAAVAWYSERRATLPSTPFCISQGVIVAHPARFYAALDAAIAGWRAKQKTARVDVCQILLPIRKLRDYMEANHADAT